MAATHTEPREPWPVLVFRDNEWRKALVHLIIDYGYEWDLHYLVSEDVSREFWTLSNKFVRARENITAGRINAGTKHDGSFQPEWTKRD